jgi:hypothetical protein
MMQKRERIQQVVPVKFSPYQSPHPSEFGVVRIRNAQKIIVREFRVPFVQEEVASIGQFRRGLAEICASGYEQVPRMLRHAPFPSGNDLLDRKRAIDQMRQTAEAIERVLALNKVFKEKDSPMGKDLVSLRRSIRVKKSSGEISNVSAVEGLEQIVDFVYETYGSIEDQK